MQRKLAALALAVVASAGVAVSGATSANASTTSTSATPAAVASVDCPHRAVSDTWIRSSPGGNQVELWHKGLLKFLPSGAPVSGKWRWIATSRWVYIPAIARDTTIACIRD
jgi:hypothetical protein